MTDAARKLMTADEFLHWRLDRPGTWELDNGVPQRKFDNGHELMAGGTLNHVRVAGNLIAALRPRLRGGPCSPLGSDLAVRNTEDRVRQPDVTIACGKGRGSDLAATEPRVIFEVLSPSTRRYDLVKKADEYRRMPSVRHLVLLEADQPRALVWTRDEDADWRLDEVDGLGGDILLPAVGATLPMAEVYEDVDLADAPA